MSVIKMQNQMARYPDTFADQLAEICVSKFNSLGKNGKPKENTEWALLACFVKEDHAAETLEVVALGTGSKCVGAKQLSPKGDVLHDSHAEVIARRAFKVYLLDQMKKTKDGQKLTIFSQEDGKYRLKTGISFHFYSSHTPCGDASIFPKQEWQDECSGENLESIEGKYLLSNTDDSNLEKNNSWNSKTDPEIYEIQQTGKSTDTEKVIFSVAEHRSMETAAPTEDTGSESTEVVSDVSTGEPPLKKVKDEPGDIPVGETKGKSGVGTAPEHDIKQEHHLKITPKEEATAACLVNDEGRNGDENTAGKIFSCTGNTLGSKKCLSTDAAQNGCRAHQTEHYKDDSMEELDIHRTGAKCVGGEKPDPKLPGSDYHVTGVLRTKPGRGNPTLSLSCSDKIFKWTVLGVQGSLLMLLLDAPIYVETVTIGQCPYSQEAMERALHGRFETRLKDIHLPSGFQIVTPVIFQSDVDFPFSRFCITRKASNPSKVRPSSTSLIWSGSDTHRNKHEVATKGRKLGATVLNCDKPSSWVSICRRLMLRQVVNLLVEQASMIGGKNPCRLSYEQLQYQAIHYNQAWEILKKHVLMNWTVKPQHMKRFTFEIEHSN